MMADLLIVEDRLYERSDARWVRLRCSTGCVHIEVRYEPADQADEFVAALRAAHAQVHRARADGVVDVA